jgi:hypothetical protein
MNNGENKFKRAWASTKRGFCYVVSKEQRYLILGTTIFFILGAAALLIFNDFFTKFMTRPNKLFGLSNDGDNTPYKYFSVQHIIMIALTIVILTTIGVVCRGKKQWINTMFYITSAITVTCALSLFLYSAIFSRMVEGKNVWNLEWFLPVHICNLFFITLPLCAFCKKKVRTFLADYTVLCGFFGCLIATCFTMHTILYYPAIHFVPFMCWLHHLCIGSAAVFLVTSGNYKRFKWFPAMSLTWLMIAFSLVFNYLLGTNFIALNLANPKAPITWFQWMFGKYGSLAMAVIFTYIAIGMQILWDVRLKRRGEAVENAEKTTQKPAETE